MTCFHPLKAYRSAEVNPSTGKRGITFNGSKALIEGGHLRLPCGQCSGCRIDRSREWALRCSHEAATSSASCFVTLTYDQQHVPTDFSVKLRDWQLFMKRLRKRFGAGVRFFGCGEYGDQTARPHYHALLFGLDFPDKTYWCKRGDHRVYTSEALEEVWGMGQCEVGSVTPASAGYVARYCTKKITGARADDHYSRVSPIDGQTYRVAPEFATMSLRPGLGLEWFARYGGDAFPSDFVVSDGRKVRPPGYYLRKLDEPGQEAIKRLRKRRAAQPAARWNSTSERLRVREEIHALRMKRLVRPL